MNKNLMALAVMSVFAAPAFGQASNVTLYGRANLSLDQYRAAGATAANADFKSRTRVNDSGSRLGVRGVEDLGGGLRAIFQIESGVNMDTGTNLGQGGQVNLSSGFLGSRPSFVGLEGGFGRLTLGRQDIWWGNGTIAQTGANYVNADIPWFTGSAGRVNAGIARQSNVVQYTTPTFGGFNTTLSYQPNSEAAQGGANINARNYGVTARWAGGPISSQIDWSEVKAATPATGTLRSTNKNLKGSVGFTYMPGAQISVIAMRLKHIDQAGAAGLSIAGDDLQQTSFGVNWEHAFGNIQALAEFGINGKVSGCTENGAVTTCSNTKSRAFMVGARYNMSKRTATYVTYNQITNQSNQTMDYVGGSVTSANTLALNGTPAISSAGADPRIIAVGVWHQF